MSGLIGFLETESAGSHEFAKTKVFAQLCHSVTRNSKCVALRCPAQRTTKKLLRLVRHHKPTHCHVFREFLQQIHCQFTGTHSQHVVHMHTNANVQFRVRKQARIALVLNETVFFQLARQVLAVVSETFGDPAWPSKCPRTPSHPDRSNMCLSTFVHFLVPTSQ